MMRCSTSAGYALPSLFERTQRQPTLALLPFYPCYFSEVLSDVNEVLSVVPIPLTAARMAIEMPQAIRAYSIAVAADWSARKPQNRRRKKAPPGVEERDSPAFHATKLIRKNSINLKSCWLTGAPPQSYGHRLAALAGAIGLALR